MNSYIDWCQSIKPDWLGFVIYLGSLLMVPIVAMTVIGLIAAPGYERAQRQREAACAAYGHKSISQDVWHGKVHETYYACRDPKTGQMYAE